MTDQALRLSRSPHTTAQRLLNASAARSYDPATDIDWDTPLLDDAWFWPPERLALYGTPCGSAWTTADAWNSPATKRLTSPRWATGSNWPSSVCSPAT